MIKFYCDRCGAEVQIKAFSYFKDTRDRNSLTYGSKNAVTLPVKAGGDHYNMESRLLCQNCMSELKNFLKIKEE